MIKTTSYDQHEIIRNIISLHCNLGIELDPTYSKGKFYQNGVEPPSKKFDLYPQTPDTVKANANCLPIDDGTIGSIMFDPPFVAGHTKEAPTGIIGERFHGFRYVSDMWSWYTSCLKEFHRILKKDGTLIFKCQDTVSSGKQFFSHVYIMQEAQRIGFCNKDLFILLSKNRIIGHNHKHQKHARKFHSYFIVLKKT